jgi:O-antigen/teichoic acid export membrane protein
VVQTRAVLTNRYDVLFANVVARLLALASLSVATLFVARTGGPSAVGMYALLRVLPGLVGVVASCGLPGAVAYFLAGPARDDRHLPRTIVAIAVVGGTVGTSLWTAAAPLFRGSLFPDISLGLVFFGGVTVLTQLLVATTKSCAQGSDDLPGANRVIVNEEFMFLPVYGAFWAAGLRGFVIVIAGLLLADVLTFVLGGYRLLTRGFFRDAGKPSGQLGGQILQYGLRAQVGGVMTLLNLRLDFVLISVITGPAVLGIYAVGSKFAELLKVPALALTYVLYPTYAREGRVSAAKRARSTLPRAGAFTVAAVVPVWFAASYLIPALYGTRFHGAITPAHIILLGLALEGVAGVVTAFLYGIGRPGLNSLAMAVGLVVTVALDLLLIPPFHATGAAAASALAYTVSTLALAWFFRSTTRPVDVPTWKKRTFSSADAR